MIASVRGIVSGLAPDGVVVEVGGVGLSMQATPSTLAGLRIGEVAALSTALIVREDSLTLFAFANDDERSVFELLQTATGVGPKLAQAMLAVHSPEALRIAVMSEDFKSLEMVPGIGRKVAQRIVLELKDRLGSPMATSAPLARPRGELGWREQVHSALLGLGFTARDAGEAIDVVAEELTDAMGTDSNVDVAAMLRKALRSRDRG
jgi:holliday junction DNA helicase RuvA